MTAPLPPPAFDEAEVDRVIRGLTKAQRLAILSAQECEAQGVWHPAGTYLCADKRVRYNLACIGIIRDYLPWANRLTPRGEAVRTRLLATNNEGEGL